MLLEIGPHLTFWTIINNLPDTNSKIGYGSCLALGTNACQTMLELLSMLFRSRVPVNGVPASLLSALEGRTNVLINVSPYAGDHSQAFWHESRLSTEYHLR